MGDLVKMNDLEALQDDRRRLLDYVLEVGSAAMVQQLPELLKTPSAAWCARLQAETQTAA